MIAKKERFPVNRVTASFMALFHVGAALAIVLFPSWRLLGLAAINWSVIASFGVGVGFHRLLTHRSFKCPKWLEYSLTLIGLTALQGNQIWWVAAHRIHHEFTEQPGDPHSPRDGAVHSHLGWLIFPDPRLHRPDVLERYAKDLYKDPFHRLASKCLLVPISLLAGLMLWLGGLPAVLWGVCVTVVVLWHGTWLVNSATHMWGSRRFETRDNSRNTWWVAILTFGEGWHNNHHAHPNSARQGLVWYEFDVNWLIIKMFGLFGLARKIRTTSL